MMMPIAANEQRDRQRRGDRGERRGVGRPGDRQDEDQPYVVGLPDGRHRLVCVIADALARAPRTRQQLPEARAEVGAGEHT